MHVCIFSKFLEGKHKGAGGMERHISLVVEGLIKKGHKVTIITSRHPKGLKKEVEKNKIIYYTFSTITRNPFTRPRFFRESAAIFNKIKNEEKIDVIHSQHEMAWGFFRYCGGYPSITVLHGMTKNEFKGSVSFKPWLLPFWIFIYPYYSYLERYCIKKSDKVVCVSKTLKKDIIANYNVPQRKVITIENGVDINKFKPMNTPEVKRLRNKYANKGEKILLYIGSLIMTKGVQLTLEVLPRLLKDHNIKFVVVGSGAFEKTLKDLTGKLDLDSKVIFTGRVPNENLPKYYNISDLFVMPTLRIEGLPYVLLESLACGIPTITSRAGGNVSIIKNKKDGILIKRGSRQDLYEAIEGLLKDKSLMKRLKANARKEAVSRFNLSKNINKLIKVYSDVI